MAIITYKFRLKDGNSIKKLKSMAGAVNFVWNYSNEIIRTNWKKSRKYTNEKALSPLTKGASKELPINSQTIQATYQELLVRTKQFKTQLRFRTAKGGKNLGWIPFKGQTVTFCGDYIVYDGVKFRLWQHRKLSDGAVVKTGSFSEDSRGRWYVNLQVKIPDSEYFLECSPSNSAVGIDPGLKTVMTLSNGVKFERPNITKKYETKLANAQRRKKKRLAKKINAKIKNSRLDFNHKASHEIAKNHNLIFFGNASSKKLVKTKMAKGVLDSGWGQIKTFLAYKSIRRQGRLVVQNEQNSTITCSSCLCKEKKLSGLSGLKVREWKCEECGAIHDRDVNSAKNILRQGHLTLRESGLKTG
jgi:putative transposase